MRTADFDYDLPPGLIAQEPIEPRDAARLLVWQRHDGHITDRQVAALPDLLHPGDLLVRNRTRVIPARLTARKTTGGAAEILLVHRLDPAADDREHWYALVRGSVRPGTRLELPGATAEVLACDADGGRHLAFTVDQGDVLALAERIGEIPLPPYIRRPATAADRERYQTVFADSPGSVAAPTASLHLTTALLETCAANGIEQALVDLAIGPGTFKPVTSELITNHVIHREHCACPAATVDAMHRCRARGGRIIAIGTTVVRTLESAARQAGGLAPYQGWTSLFLHPPQQLTAIDGLLTNFHLPRSSLLMLVACLTGLAPLHHIYRHAIAARYRFYSYGDAMLLLP